MKTIAALFLSLCLPAIADDFAVTFDKDGTLSIGEKKVDANAYGEAVQAAADKSKEGQTSKLKLAVRCAPETPWGPVQNCMIRAAEARVWDIKLTLGDTSVDVPLPHGCDDDPEIFFPDADESDHNEGNDEKNGLGTGGGKGGKTDGKDGGNGEKKDDGGGDKRDVKRIPQEIRVFLWTGEIGDLAKDSVAERAKGAAAKPSATTWARLNDRTPVDVSSKWAAVLEAIHSLVQDEQKAGTKDPAALLDIAPTVAMKQVFALVSALKNGTTGSTRVDFAMPLPAPK